MKAKIFSCLFLGLAAVLCIAATAAFAVPVDHPAAMVYAFEAMASAPSPSIVLQAHEAVAFQVRSTIKFADVKPERTYAVNHTDNIVSRPTFAKVGATFPDWAMRSRSRMRILV